MTFKKCTNTINNVKLEKHFKILCFNNILLCFIEVHLFCWLMYLNTCQVLDYNFNCSVLFDTTCKDDIFEMS